MGNDVSSKTARTPIPLDESVCWQLSNGINEQSEPISIFIAKQTFSVECRRSIQFLKTIRHPNLIKFYSDFKTFVDHDSFIGDCVHPLANKLNNNDIDSTAKLCLGLYQLTQALEFLHQKASVSHNNVCLLSIYISLNGIWKLGNFECASRYESINKKYLSSLKLIRSEECITPEEDQKNSDEINKEDIYAIDVYGFGTFIRQIMTIVNVDDSLKSLLNDLEENLTNEDPHSRPTWSMLLKTQLFQTDYIKATELLDRLPTIDESDLPNAVDSLSTYLDNLDIEYFNELLIGRLFVPFMFLCPLTRSKIIPQIIIPKDEINKKSWISIEKYRRYIIPILIDLYSYHVTCIRETLLEYFNSYCQFIDQVTLKNLILPQLIYGLKDSNNRICMLTLTALASMVEVLGADVVVGGQRKQIFTDTLKRANVALPKTAKTVPTTESTNNSPLTTPALPQKIRKPSPVTVQKTKPLRSKSRSPVRTKAERSEPPPSSSPTILPQYTNGHDSSLKKSIEQTETNIIENGISDNHIEDDIDNDDGQWSDWEHNPNPSDSPNDFLQTLTSASPPPPPPPVAIEQPTSPKSPISSSKSLKLTNISKPKWNPNAPLGSEYEIPPVVLTKKNSITTTTNTSTNEDIDDFFKDMAPKVESVELMRQLETMFSVNTNTTNQQTKSTLRTTSFSNKFGIASQNVDDNQEIESGNNNWDE